ncbi:hypothetical protein [Actinoallomurus iriomotensis]|uniref:Uncharacterized protein n=1 Tax=Actinoallomurus iriomotensis TaxID=478107 RepID=A0A9W6VU91_9ACTN|nr:hypothetical protein [Actinoallomurus iriomotensis]GLY80525.1 hypothetical protein Airi01_087920 [Actinoallomurus iriomotensis]
MSLHTYRAVANGIRTDHPIPNLPFVDDSHIPLDDPVAIEAIGRHKADDMFGREDRCTDGGWLVFTTDPLRHDLGWVVRWHPEHGRSVMVYRDDDVASVHMVMGFEEQAALLFRAGGYWWDGTTWYRPGQVWDGPGEKYYRRQVPAAVTVTAKDMLTGGDPARARVLSITELDVESVLGSPAGDWRDALALWASRHDGDPARAVVALAAPELTGDQLVGVAEMAGIAGIGASTLRAYVSRGEGDVPLPQSTVGGRSMWARPVAEEWAEQRHRSAEGRIEAVGVDRETGPLPPGIAEVWTRFSRSFFSQLWERPTWRKRWALRWRTESAVREIAETLSWDVAADVTKLVRVHDLAHILHLAMLREFAHGQELDRSIAERDEHDPSEHDHNDSADRPWEAWGFYGITPPTARMLDWLIRHDPATAAHTIEEIIGEAERRLEISRQVSERSIKKALSLDGTLDKDARHEFLERVFSPRAVST